MKIVSDDGKREFNSVEEALAWEEALKQLKAREENERKAKTEEEKRKKEELQKEFELLSHEVRTAYKTMDLVLDKVSEYEKKTGKVIGVTYNFTEGDYSLHEVKYNHKRNYGELSDVVRDLTKYLRMK